VTSSPVAKPQVNPADTVLGTHRDLLVGRNYPSDHCQTGDRSGWPSDAAPSADSSGVTTLRDQSLRPAALAQPEAPRAETVSSHGSSRLRAWVRTWLVLVAALLVAGAAGYGIVRVHDYAAEHGELKAMLSRIEIVAHQQSALEWQAIAEGGLSPELAQQWREVDEVVDSLPLRLARRDDSPEIGAVRDAFAAYDAAVDQQYDQLASRSLAEAEALDERRVDPAFDQLLAALGVASSHYDAAAQQANQRADLGTVLLLLFAATIIGVLVWRFQRARAKAAELLAHQALHDGLTGLPNRTLLRDRTDQAIRQTDRELVPAGLLLLDLDRFKEVNDTPSATTTATNSWSRSANGSRRPCGRSTPWPGWAGMSSPCCCPASKPPRAR